MTDFGPVYVRETDGILAIGNDALERGICVRNRIARTAYLLNKLDGTEERIESSEFELDIQDGGKLTAFEFTFVRHWTHGQTDHTMGVMAARQSQVQHVGRKVLPALRTAVNRVAQMDIARMS